MTTTTAPRVRGDRARTVGKHVVLAVFSVLWLVPMYLIVINTFKPQHLIFSQPFSLPWPDLSPSYLVAALNNPNFDVLQSYAVSGGLVIAGNVLSFLLCGPAAFVIARGIKKRYHALYFYLIMGTFIPSQIVLIPIVYVLGALGLQNTLLGLMIFQTTLTIPVSMFLFVAYIRTIPTDIDEAARVDGAGWWRIFISVIIPLMRPAIATAVILHSVGLWNDFVNPQILLGPGTDLKPVTTGIYYAIGPYSTDYNVVFPSLLLVVAPVVAFFIFMQRHIIGGLTAGATKF